MLSGSFEVRFRGDICLKSEDVAVLLVNASTLVLLIVVEVDTHGCTGSLIENFLSSAKDVYDCSIGFERLRQHQSNPWKTCQFECS
jgi:hypothetical protein